MQKSIVSFGGLLFLRAAIASLLAFIVYMSVAFIFTSLGTKEIGFSAALEKNGVVKDLGSFYNDDPDVESKLEQAIRESGLYEEESDEALTPKRVAIRSEMPGWMKVLSFIIAEICMIGMYTSMLYVSAWEEGNRNYNQVRYEHAKEDPMRGLKAGLVASIPCFGAWLILLISRFSGWLPTFGGTVKWFFVPFFPIVTAALPTVASADAVWWAFPVLLALQAVKPLACHFAYRMGYADKTLKAIILYKGNEKAARKKRR